jgi:hypothetical protein
MDKNPGSVPKMIEIQAERSGGTTGLTPRWPGDRAAQGGTIPLSLSGRL